MPPSRTAPKTHVYAITRRDFDHHTDSANQAAKAHLHREYSKGEFQEERMEDVNKDGGYDGWGYVMGDRRNHFRVEVKKMELKGKQLADAKARVPDVGASAKLVLKAPAKEDGTRKQPVAVS
ncbi:MAG: hypothetical protein L6R42_000241 [Xanthoria sp. 1 TBL-2021]|nr:MAG: hypothetical protein L6R42_000241 [Xanthoria sp. 1 TBL-2021]